MTAEAPYIAALNLTRRCNLACAHCYLDAGVRAGGGDKELSEAEALSVIGEIGAMTDGAMVVLTGGEPLMRPDLYRLAEYATSRGLMTVIGTNGVMLNPDRVDRLKRAGVAGVGISLDSLDSRHHDAFRGMDGAWERTMAGIDACRAAALPFQLHFSATDDNAHELDDMIAFAKSAGALALNVFFLVCTGRGETVSNISPDSYERILQRVTRAAHEESALMVRAKCAPHFKRMAMEFDPAWPITASHGYEAGACLAGTRYFRVTPEGGVTACPYMEQEAGSVRESSLQAIWDDAPQFQALRAPKLQGRCGLCEYRKLCGGCRARPLARSGELMGEDFLCAYQPRGGAVIDPLPVKAGGLDWSEEAERRVGRIPSFVRPMVRRRAEDHVRGEGRSLVTGEDLSKLARLKFGDGLRKPDFVRGAVSDD